MNNQWYIGQKIVCIDTNFSLFRKANEALNYDIILPKKDEIYTIRIIELSISKPGFTFWLKEIVNDNKEFITGNLEPGFLEYHFAPLQSLFNTQTEQDIKAIEQEIKLIEIAEEILTL